MAQCVYCKIEKVVKEVKRINNVDCSFCSEGEVLFCSMWLRVSLSQGQKVIKSSWYDNDAKIFLVQVAPAECNLFDL